MTLPIYGEKCISEDASASGFPNATSCSANTTIIFKDTTDYHLNTGDIYAIGGGESLALDENYPFDTDIDGNLISYPWSVGADNAVRKIVFSVGSTATLTGSPNITISKGKATFTIAQTGTSFGVGHLINYSTSKTCYIIEKISTTIFRVALATGLLPSDELTPVAVNSVIPSFSSLVDAINGSSSGVYTAIGSTPDLVSANLQVDIACYNISDTGSSTISSSWITDQFRYITIYSPTNTTTQCNTIQKFSGKYGSGYQLSGSLIIETPYSKIDGLQITPTTGQSGIMISNAANTSTSNCLIRGYDGASTGIVSSNNIAGINSFVNNLIYDCSTVGIHIISSGAISGDTYYCYNNNTINCNKGLWFNSDSSAFFNKCVVKNHISQFNIIADYAFTPLGTGRFLISHSVSGDETSNNFELHRNKINTSATFLDYTNKDFHLNFDDVNNIGYGVDLTYDEIFNFNTDIDNEVRSPGYWCPGVDNFHNIAPNEVFYSVGANTSSLLSFTQTITIGDGIATFDIPQVSSAVGIGDEITYNTSTVCYLAFKMTPYTWRVVTAVGGKPTDIVSSNVVSINRSFNSLSDALGLISNSDHLNTNDLTSLPASVNLVCYDDGVIDNSAVSVSGFTTSALYKLKIYSAYNTNTQSNTNNQHLGRFGTGYTIAPSTSAAAITINNANVEVRGIQINAVTGYNGIVISNNDNIIIKNNLIKNANIGIYDSSASASHGTHILSNIIYDCTLAGISVQKDIVYNNTVVNCVTGYISDVNSDLKNNIGFNNGTQDFNYNTTIEYCVSKDSSAGSSNNCVSNVTPVFLSTENKDYHLQSTDTIALDNGLNLSSEFQTDINNNKITEWSIGADCPVFNTVIPTTTPPPVVGSIKSVYYSIGAIEGTHHTGDNTTIVIDNNGLVTFSEPQTSEFLGVGDKMVYAHSKACYLKQKYSNTAWYVVDELGSLPPVTAKTTVLSITRAFDSLYTATSDTGGIATILGSKDLVGLSKQLNIACYSDGFNETNSNYITGWNTSSDCNIKIYTPTNTQLDCNVNQRHRGMWGYGYRIYAYTDDAIKIEGIHYITIEGMQVQAVANNGNGIHLIDCAYSVVLGNIAYGCGNNGIFNETNIGGSSWNVIVNNLCYNNTGAGIYDVGTGENPTYMFNNTCVKNHYKGIYIDNPYSHLSYLINNLCQSNRGGAYGYTSPTNSPYLIRCMSNDYTAYTEPSRHFQCLPDMYINFTDRVNDNYTLSPYTDNTAINSGIDLTTVLPTPLSIDSPYPFNIDICGRDRSPSVWDIGAFELSRPFGMGQLIYEALSTKQTHGKDQNDFSTALVIYLRKIADRDNTFTSLKTLSEYLQTDIYNSYIVYVQGGVSFFGTLDFGDRGTNKFVTMQTDYSEQHCGPASLIARSNTGISGAPLISDSCAQSVLGFYNLKLQMNDNYLSELFARSTASTKDVIIENCIVQTTTNTLFDVSSSMMNRNIKIYNSILIYRNINNETNLYLNTNSNGELFTSNLIENTIIITNNLDNDEDIIHFNTLDHASGDIVRNCLLWNFSGRGEQFDNNTVTNCLTQDPLFLEGAILPTNAFNIATVMANSFKLRYDSPSFNTGFINTDHRVYIDILGKIRKTDSIDIGPYNIEILVLWFNASGIKNLYQDKLQYDSVNKIFSSSTSQYSHLAQKLLLNDSACVEYARGSKLIMKLQDDINDYILNTDKLDKPLTSVQAFYDDTHNVLIFSKIPYIIGDVFRNIFNDGEYAFMFNDSTNILDIYIVSTYDKGMSGYRSIVNNARFGGPTTLSK